EFAKTVRTAEFVFNGKDVGWVVSRGNVACELAQRHQFDGVNPQISQVIETSNGRIKRTLPLIAIGAVDKSADVYLVDDQFIPRRRRIVRGGIALVATSDEAVEVAVAVNDGARVRIVPPERV